MFFYILDFHSDALAAEQTYLSVRAIFPDMPVCRLHAGHAAELNRQAASLGSPFFVTLHAGETVMPAFRSALYRWIYQDMRNTPALAGICPAGTDNSPRGPLVWRLEAVREAGGFADSNHLPFPHYMGVQLMNRLSAGRWQWRHEPLTGLLRTPNRGRPLWHKSREEWQHIRPLLQPAGRIPLTPPAGEPAVSVVICAYNEAEHIHWAIQSVRLQGACNWELIIVDDGSSDGTFEQLEQYKAVPQVRLLRNEHNAGKAACLNRALEAVRGRWLLELDADDWLADGSLRILADAADANPDAGLLYADRYDWQERFNKQIIYRGIAASPPSLHPSQLLAQGLPVAPRMYRTEALRTAGGWWEDGLYDGRLYEDIQILCRLAEACSMTHLPQPLYHRRIRSGSASQSNQELYPSWRNWFISALQGDR
ncbi:glycosyltransferase family 2 protein [Paenibacillus tarimensis]|uniref:glycosyltransferase family 2 protein n=1 Tax=Paenibacillus tarimensis TaxID=416012 RepID=UPI001F47011C|nr:glycosyltransferase family 2 protein [Paenibacillus tarimensis]MCF2944912.1 glycosyltransferase family 2 protein [Paenibacillus tarimensis]